MIDASAFLSVAGARAPIDAPRRRCATPVAALAAGFTRRAAPLGCVVQLFAPHRPRRRGRAAGRRAAGAQGRLRHRPARAPPGRPASDGHAPSRRGGAAATGRAWRAEPGRAGHGRTCLRRHGGEPARASPDEPAGQRGGGRRLFQRLGGRGGGRPVPGLAGHGHRRLGPHAGRDLRPDRPEAHAGTLVRARRGPARADAGHGGRDRPRRTGRRQRLRGRPARRRRRSRLPCGWTRWSASWRARGWRIANALHAQGKIPRSPPC